MSELNTPRLMAAAKEFNIGKDTLVDFLVSKGFNNDDLKPTAKLTEPMYRVLQSEFQQDKAAKEKAEAAAAAFRSPPRGLPRLPPVAALGGVRGVLPGKAEVARLLELPDHPLDGLVEPRLLLSVGEAGLAEPVLGDELVLEEGLEEGVVEVLEGGGAVGVRVVALEGVGKPRVQEEVL